MLPASPFDLTLVAGGQAIVSHQPWQEEELQSAYIDWVIVNDVSFRIAAHESTRGSLTWNRISLLRALPSSPTTVSKYVVRKMRERKEEVIKLLRASESKISISCDMWASPNNVDFLGVVAHFVSMYAYAWPWRDYR